MSTAKSVSCYHIKTQIVSACEMIVQGQERESCPKTDIFHYEL